MIILSTKKGFVLPRKFLTRCHDNQYSGTQDNDTWYMEKRHWAEQFYSYAECSSLVHSRVYVFMLSAVMLSVCMLSVSMLSVCVLSVIMLRVIMLDVICLSIVVLSVVMLSFFMLVSLCSVLLC